jgi:putative FmdB family regulatory protein
MPIYQYQCSKCNKIFDLFRLSIKKEYPTAICIHCGAIAKKIVSQVSKFIFK